MAAVENAVRQRYLEALDQFIARVRQDSYIIAAILCGSLAYDTVWEKSDIDIVLVGRDEKRPFRMYALVEDGINIHVALYSRSRFKKDLEQSLQSSFLYSYMARSRLLFSLDPSIADYYEGIERMGAADRERGLLLSALDALPQLTKAEKWLYHRHDPSYSYLWLTYLITDLARIEVILHDEVPGREVVQQAMRYNEPFFRAVYFDLVDRSKDEATVQAAIEAVVGYLEARAAVLFRPVFNYLAAAGGPRSMTEINEYFSKRLQTNSIGYVCEWLAERGMVEQLAAPLRMTEKSRATVEELAYFYDRDA